MARTKKTATPPEPDPNMDEFVEDSAVVEETGESKVEGDVNTDQQKAIELDLGGTVSTLSVTATPPEPDPNMVKVRISYPSGYRGPRILKNGKEYEVSPEIAERFKAKGIVAND